MLENLGNYFEEQLTQPNRIRTILKKIYKHLDRGPNNPVPNKVDTTSHLRLLPEILRRGRKEQK